MKESSAEKINQQDPLTPGPVSGAADDIFRTTLEGTHVGVWEADMLTQQAWRSKAHAAIFGDAAREVEPWSLNDFRNHVYWEDRELVERAIREGLRNGTGWGIECRILRKDNTLRWVNIRSVPVPGNSAPSHRFRGIVMDVTERKVAEMAAQESDRRFVELANAAPVFIWSSGVDKRCDFFNKPWLEFTGRTMEQELGYGWTERVHPEDLDRCLATYQSHFDVRRPFRMEYRLRRHDGVYRWILDCGQPRFLPDGVFIGYMGSCVDFTEQRLDQERAEEAARSAKQLQGILEEITAQQQAILNTSPIGIGHIRNRRIVWSNPALQSLLGYKELELYGLPTEELYPNRLDYQMVGIEGYEIVTRGGTYTADLQLKRKGGDIFWCQITGKSVNSADPESGSIWLLKDIDAIRQADAEFRLQSAMLSHMGEGVVLVSEQSGKIVHTNPKFDRMLGYAAGELHGQPISVANASSEFTREEIAARIFAELRHNGSWEGDIENQRKDGTIIVCHASVSRFQHAELGDVWMSVHTDITKAKQMERALREAKERYDDLINQVPCGIQTVRLLPNGTYKFDFISPRTAQLLGVEREDLYQDATLWTRNAWPEDAAKAAEETARCIATKAPYLWEGRFNVEGAVRWLRFEGRPIAQLGGDVLWNAVVNDITEQKTLEAAQREAQKLTAIGHLAGGMAHEFNNILASMLLNIGLAQVNGAPPSIVDLLRDLEKGCVRAGGLVKQLLAFSQKSVLTPRQIDLNDFLDRQIALLQAELGDGIQLKLSNSVQSLSVTGDSGLLEQALRSLCENASEAMSGQGLIRICLEAKEVGSDRMHTYPEARPGRFAVLSVSDKGCGIDPKTRLRLFEPFFTTREIGRGTGLGLATVLGIVRQHQGWIEVESEIGRGSCFRIYLPLTGLMDRPSVPRPAEPSPTSGTATILLTEDDPGLRNVVSRLLKHAGYRVLEAQDAAEARALWEAHGADVDLLLSDVVMPGTESGLQLAQRLLQQRPTLKVILTSGYSRAMDSQSADFQRQIVFLAKPVSYEELLQTIRQLLQSSR